MEVIYNKSIFYFKKNQIIKFIMKKKKKNLYLKESEI